jgi:hypothetical protein
MKTEPNSKSVTQSGLTFMTAAVFMSAAFTASAVAQTSAVDPAATEILKRMTDYVGGLKQFSVETQTTLEDLIFSGHRVDIDVSAHSIVSRPNRIRAQRTGDLVDQVFYYDGKTLTLHNPGDEVYATVPAPGTIEETLSYVLSELELIIPVSDLLYPDAYSLLMQDVTLAQVVSKTVINGITCDHVLFSRPGVDFQMWVADSGPPLPIKYVVTDTGVFMPLSIVTVMSNWDLDPDLSDSLFSFEPGPDDVPISFLPLISTGNDDS